MKNTTPHPSYEDFHSMAQDPDVASQLRTLRRSLRMTQIAAGIALVAALIPWSTWTPSPDPQDELLVLKDRAGNRRIALHADGANPYIALYGTTGPARVRLEVFGDDGRLSLIHREGGTLPAEGAFLRGDVPSLELTTGRRGSSVTLMADPRLPHVELRGPGAAHRLLTSQDPRAGVAEPAHPSSAEATPP